MSLQRPDWPANVDDDKEGDKFAPAAVAADERLLVAGYHMPFPDFGHVERLETAFRWVPTGISSFI